MTRTGKLWRKLWKSNEVQGPFSYELLKETNKIIGTKIT